MGFYDDNVDNNMDSFFDFNGDGFLNQGEMYHERSFLDGYDLPNEGGVRQNLLDDAPKTDSENQEQKVLSKEERRKNVIKTIGLVVVIFLVLGILGAIIPEGVLVFLFVGWLMIRKLR